MERKTTVWIFQETNKGTLIWEDEDMAKEGEPFKRKRISFKSSKKQHKKDQLC